MNTPATQVPDVHQAIHNLNRYLRMVQDAISRAEDNIHDGQLYPTTCEYIDGQLARAIGYLASARAVVITHAALDHPHFVGDETIDLDAQAEASAPVGKSDGEKDGGS